MFFAAGFVSADFSDADLNILNPDPNSQALGGSINALSGNVSGFFYNPANNFKNYSKEFQISYLMLGRGVRGETAALLIPTKNIGNFSFMFSHAEYAQSDAVTTFGSSMMFALNYVYPLVTKYPIYTEKGGIGLTVKGYQLKNRDSDAGDCNMYSVDLGLIYNLDFIDSDLIGAVAFKNIGNDMEFNGVSQKQPQITVASARYLLSDAGKVSLMADVIKVSEIDETGFAAGLEFTPFYPVTFRTGWRDYRDNFNKGVTAGLSFDFDNVKIGYSFSDTPETDNDQHTVSMGFYFGSMPDPDKAYEHYLGYHLKKAQQAYDDKDYVSARRQFEDILAIYPDDSVARHYIKLLSEDLEQEDQNNIEVINKYLAKAEVAFMKNNVLKARKYYLKVTAMDANNQEALEGLKKVDGTIKERDIYKNRKKHQKEITDSWILAMKYYDKGDFMYAKEELEKIIAIDPENAGAIQYLETIQKKIDRVNVIQSHAVFKQGIEAYEKGDYEGALSYFNAAYIVNPQREDIKAYINQCNIKINASKSLQQDESAGKSNKQIGEEMKKVYNAGLELFSRENYTDALKKFELLKNMSAKYKFYDYREQTNTYIDKSRSYIADRLVKEGNDLELREEFEKAYAKYKEALSYVKDNQQAQKGIEKLNSIVARQYYEQGLKAFSAGNKEDAVKFLEESLKYEPNKIEAKRALERIK